MAAITTENLLVKRGVKNILNNININIKSREHTILFGLNGCGKTSLLATISGYMGYTSGEIRINGELLSEQNVLKLRQQIGFVSNSYFDRCFKRENALNIVLSGLYGQLAERYDITSANVLRAKHLLKSLGIKEKIAYPYDLLSRGQQQRVLIARALMVSPKILLLDEPCSGLDVLSRQYFLNTIKQIADESDATIICATHYGEEILPFFSKAILLKKGEIFADGDIQQILSNDVLSEFFQSPTICHRVKERMYIEIVGDYKMPTQVWR